MDVVTELTARAATYIGILQDILAHTPEDKPREKRSDEHVPLLLSLQVDSWLIIRTVDDTTTYRLTEPFQKAFYGSTTSVSRALELVIPEESVIKSPQELTKNQEVALITFISQAGKLVHTVLHPEHPLKFFLSQRILRQSAKFPSPDSWRRALRAFLYKTPQERFTLAVALGESAQEPYLPMLVRTALNNKNMLKQKRAIVDSKQAELNELKKQGKKPVFFADERD